MPPGSGLRWKKYFNRHVRYPVLAANPTGLPDFGHCCILLLTPLKKERCWAFCRDGGSAAKLVTAVYFSCDVWYENTRGGEAEKSCSTEGAAAVVVKPRAARRGQASVCVCCQPRSSSLQWGSFASQVQQVSRGYW